MTRILVTGSGSGLGRFLHEQLGCEGLRRGEPLPGGRFDAIIHCAVNTAHEVGTDSLFRYVDDNLLLAERLCRIPHDRFVLVSTCDVYPRAETRWREDAVLDPEAIDRSPRLYPTTKLMAEAVVREMATLPLILRPTALLGPYVRRGTVLRLVEDEHPQLKLAAGSVYNFVLHEDILGFIRRALELGLSGVYNLASADEVRLDTLAARLGAAPAWGDILYQVAPVDGAKAAKIVPELGQGSLAAFDRWLSARLQQLSRPSGS